MQIKGSIIVITGASSGNGKAIAQKLAQKGAILYLASRGKTALQQAVDDCSQFTDNVQGLPTDTSDPKQVKKLGDSVYKKNNRIDVWINNAAIYPVGKFEDMPMDVFEQTVRTNFMGYVYGAREAISIMKKQKEGIIANTISVDGLIPTAYATPYTASKFAVHGFMNALRQEVNEYNIKICNVYPSAMNTPLFEHAPNFFGKQTRPPKPVYDPNIVGEAYVKLIENPKDKIVVGNYGKFGSVMYKIFPSLVTKRFASVMKKRAFTDKKEKPNKGNAFKSTYEKSKIKGRWK